jgi:hypothetical protein
VLGVPVSCQSVSPVAVQGKAQPMACSPWCRGWFTEGCDTTEVQDANTLRNARGSCL